MTLNIKFLKDRPIAHRGLHGLIIGSGKIAQENSLTAFDLAIEKNFSIELDIQFTLDFNIIVFHDYFLSRLTNKKGLVCKKSLSSILEAKLSNGETIPTIEEALNLIDGRVPILIEIKYSNHIKRNIEIFSNVLENKIKFYKGDIALMSFSISLMSFLREKKLFNFYPLGLVTNFSYYEKAYEKKKNTYIEKCIRSNKLNFISQNCVGIKNNRIERLKKFNIAILVWTIISKKVEAQLRGMVDNITFEQYDPDNAE